MTGPMTCRLTVGALRDYVDGVLPGPARHALEHHLARCPRCTEFLAAYRAVPAIVRRATDATLPTAVAARLGARLREIASDAAG